MSNPKHYTLDSIAREAANDLGLFSNHHYAQFLGWAVRGYREVYFDFAGKPVPCILEMDDLRTVCLPSWAVDWIKIGMMLGERVVFFGRAEDMAIYNFKNDCGEPIPNAPHAPIEQHTVGIGLGPYISRGFGHPLSSMCTDGRWSYSSSAKYNGMFIEEGQYPYIKLRFSTELPKNTKIYAELLTDGIDVCGETFVHPYLYEYVVASIHYFRVKSNDSSSPYLKKEKKDEKNEARKISLMRMNSIGPEEMSNVLASAFRLGTKR